MKRAAVLIGVDKTGTLPKLRDAARGAERMAEWARAQGMNPVHVFTDAAGPVEVKPLKQAITALVDAANIGQLVIYFAGHGVNRQRKEYWLLSDAPDDSQAAVNVEGSVALASTCGIPHIVFISDACRTAAEGIRAQSVTGSEIFPNREGDTTPVDQFFACQLGRPSHEIKDPNVTSAEFNALYTSELVPALSGERKKLVAWTTRDSATVGLIHPRALRDHLKEALALRLKDLQLETKVIQVPAASISSDPPAWLSRVQRDKRRGRGLGFGIEPPPPTTVPAPSSDFADNVAAVQDGLASDARTVRGEGVVRSAIRLAQPFGPMHHETECGFKIRGARIVTAHSSRDARTEINDAGDDVRVGTNQQASVLLVLDSGTGALLPAIRGFLTAMTVDDGELVDVAYEPSDNSWRWPDFQRQAMEIRALRSIAAASLSRGEFHLEGSDTLRVARRMQYAKGIDPSLAVYAAYAYHALQRVDLIREMAHHLSSDLGAPLFDVALLSRALDKKSAADVSLISPVPLLAQGWSLLNAYRVSLAPALQSLDERLSPSLWTLFDEKGVEQVKDALTSGAIR